MLKSETHYQRPWWLVVNKPWGLVTTIEEEVKAGERTFIIEGEPLIQSLAWLTWGPAGAMAMVILLTAIAIGGQIREQAWSVRGLFIMAYLVLPALAWVGQVWLIQRLAKKHLEAERQAERQECFICLNRAKRELVYQTTAQPQRQYVSYDQIRQVKISSANSSNETALRLCLDTLDGTITLLPEKLGSRPQKIELAQQLEQAMSQLDHHKS